MTVPVPLTDTPEVSPVSKSYENIEMTAFDGWAEGADRPRENVRVTFDVPRSLIENGPPIRLSTRWTLTPS